MDGARLCSGCGLEKPLSAFPTRLGHKKKPCYRRQCKTCHALIRHETYERNKERVLAQQKRQYQEDNSRWRNQRYRKAYGISLDVYNQMLTIQASGCAICGHVPSETENALCVDHDHGSGQVRDLLCGYCNLMIGNARDKVDLLLAGVDYLERHKPSPQVE